jgi:hypothetical protein
VSSRRKVPSVDARRPSPRPATPRRPAKALTVRVPRANAAHDSRATAASTTYVWRRLHDGVLIGEASPVRGMGSWRVSAYPTANSAEVVYEQQAFSLLREAHAAADELVRRHFQHTCRTGVCGRWLRWAEE